MYCVFGLFKFTLAKFTHKPHSLTCLVPVFLSSQPSESSDRTGITVITFLVTAAVTSGIVGPLAFLLGRKRRRETRDEETGAQLNGCHTTNHDQSSGDQHVSTNGFKRPPDAPEEITLLPNDNNNNDKE